MARLITVPISGIVFPHEVKLEQMVETPGAPARVSARIIEIYHAHGAECVVCASTSVFEELIEKLREHAPRQEQRKGLLGTVAQARADLARVGRDWRAVFAR
jgi:hypothetical protein